MGKSYDSLQVLAVPSYCFVDVCKFDELSNDILVPQSTLYIHQNGKPFDIEKEEIKVILEINIMISYYSLPEINNYFSNERDLSSTDC